jgi:hypothetical protein
VGWGIVPFLLCLSEETTGPRGRGERVILIYIGGGFS